MNVHFDPTLGKLYDFFHVFTCSKIVDETLEEFKSSDIVHYKEIADAYHFVLDGIDTDTPGLASLVESSRNSNGFLYSRFLSYIWDYKTTDIFIESFDRLLLSDLRYDLLSFYDTEQHPKEYYRIIAENTASLYNFVSKLNVSDRIKLELIGIAAGSDIYYASLKPLFTTIADRIDRVYEKYSDIISMYANKMQCQFSSKEDFVLMKTPEFREGHNEHPYNAVRVVMSFFNPIIVHYMRSGPDVDVFLGIENKYQRTYENGSILKYGLFFKAMSDDSRIRIIELLRDREMYIGEIAKSLDIPLTTLSYHIKMLNDTGIIKLREEGKKTYCIFSSAELKNAMYALASIARLPQNIV